MAGYDINDVLSGLSPEERNELMWTSMSGGLAQIAPLLGRRDAGIGTLLAAFGAGMGGARQQALGDIEGRKYRQTRMQAEQAQLDLQRQQTEAQAAAQAQQQAWLDSLPPEMRQMQQAFTYGGGEFAKRLYPDAKDAEKPQIFGSAESGYYSLGPDGRPQKLVSGAGRAPPEPKVVGDRLVDPRTGRVIADFSQGAGGGMFEGKSVDADALDYLVQQGKITPEQAAEFAAGKMATGPGGETFFVPPSAVYPSGAAPPALGATPQPGGMVPAPSLVPAQPGTAPGIIPLKPATPPTTKASLEEQNVAGFRDRIMGANKVIDETTDAGLSALEEAKDLLPSKISNYIKTTDRQRLEQAQRDWINANLRRESGAVINEDEFDNARKQYFPQPGDTAEVVDQKRQNRATVENSFKRATQNVPMGQTPAAVGPAPPAPGEVRNGYRFKGGDPADPNSWEQAGG